MQSGHHPILHDDLSSDVSPYVATPSSSSASHDHSPYSTSRSANNLNAPRHHLSSNTVPGSNVSGSSKVASATDKSSAPGGPERGRSRTKDDEPLVDPAHYEDDDDGGFGAWDEDDDDDYQGNVHFGTRDAPADMDNANTMNGIGGGTRSSQPLLGKEDRGRPSYDSPAGSARPPFHSRRSTFRSRSPDYQAAIATKKKYTYAAFFLGLSLVTFVVQTETAVYIQHKLKWDKAYCMLWLTHGSWSLLWPVMFGILRLQKRDVPFDTFWRRHKQLLRTTAQMVESQHIHLNPKDAQKSPIPYILRTTAYVTSALTVAGGSWYVAVNLTTPSDLTAIYNCSAFFAYAFSIPLLGDKLRLSKVFSVGIAIIGVLVVAYGDAAPAKHGTKSGGSVPGSSHQEEEKEASHRLLGNIIIGIGSVLYGLYEVMYKKYACPPEGTSPGRGMMFAMTFGSLIGMFTLTVLWIPLPILHFTGLETFEMPTGEVAWMLAISTLMNATFSGSFLVLISLTSPVLSSVAALLTIFLVAITSSFVDGEPLTPAAIFGGLLITAAFSLLSWDTYKEMKEEQRRKEQEADVTDDEDD